MKDIFKLYINGNLVDFNEEPNISFTYQLEDLSNPTIIKNNFSKSITINGTDNNNRIFGEIYNLDREQIYKFNTYDGAYFDPSKRTPFALYKNAELLESGYMQLTDITIKDKKITYNITLYGGLGDFFYSLMYNDEGEKKTLADLYYKIEDANGNIMPKDDELDFTINKDFVRNCWEALNNDNNKLENFISFAPSYNGLYEDFSNNTYLINTWASQLFQHNNITVDNVTYKPYEGYLLANTETEFTEWEIRDLRSYMQRPCLKFKKLFNAICDEENNGGYRVNLDNTFFNDNNPYYSKTFMALPLLQSIADGTNSEDSNNNLYVDTAYYGDTLKVNATQIQTTYNLGVDGEEITTSSADGFIVDLTNFPYTSFINLLVNFELNFVADQLNSYIDNTNLYLSHIIHSSITANGHSVATTLIYYRSLICQVIVYDVDEPNTEYVSKVLNFTSQINYGGKTYTSTPNEWVNNEENYINNDCINVLGNFVRQSESNNYKWVEKSGTQNFSIAINEIPKMKRMGIKFKMGLKYNQRGEFVDNKFLSAIDFLNISGGNLPSVNENYGVGGNVTAPLLNGSEFNTKTFDETFRSNSRISKRTFLKTEFSPCDVLLDYCKLFGLYFFKDKHSKTINIMTKNTFFKNNIIDISSKIDYSQEMKIKPQLFETKYYLMKNEENDSYYSKMYKNEYNITYGQKRIDTNYNFNKDTKNVYEGSVFQNAITVTDTSPYYKTFLTGFYEICPAFMTETVTVKYYNSESLEIKSTEKQYGYNHWINYNLTNDWNKKSGYDIFPKTCFYNLDNNSKSLSDISSTLLFFNGWRETKDYADEFHQMTVPFWLTDDVEQMLKLNDNQVCYLITDSEINMQGDRIAYKYTSLPQFTRYYTNNNNNNNNVAESFDFGVPKEVYIPSLTYNEDATLYNKFWRNYLTDRYNVNTRKVTCYVNLKGMEINQNFLKNFFYFNNCIWVINKIDNYSPNSLKTTKVEFVKVNDTENYLNAQQRYGYDAITLSEYEATVDWSTTTYSIDVTSNNNWNASSTLQGYSITPTSGTQGTTTVVVEARPNITKEYPTVTPYTFEDENGNSATFKLTQFPSPSNARFVYGYVYDEQTQKPLANYELSFRNELSDEYTTESIVMTNKDGYYELWVGKSSSDAFGNVWVVILNEDGDEVYSNFIYWESLKPKERKDFEIG